MPRARTTLYVVEGEALSLTEVQARCPDVNPHTVRSRLVAGLRRWADLRSKKPPARKNHPWR